MALKDILIVSATSTTVIQFLSGLFTARKVWRMGTPGDLSPVPFSSAVVGCSLWLFYGYVIGDSTVIYTNVVGVVLNLLYVMIFLFYTTKRGGLARQSLGAFLFLGFMVLYIGSLPDKLQQKNTLGLVCVVVTLICCASPLIALKLVIQTKSTETLPFPLILSMFLVCSQWWLYGVIIDDFYMQVTNFLGTIIALAQLSLFLLYPSGKKGKGAMMGSGLGSVLSSVPPYAPLKNQS